MIDIYKNIDYNKLRQIRRASFISALSCFICKEEFQTGDDLFLTLEFLSTLIFFKSVYNKTESKTKDIKEIRQIYDEIIRDYNKLNEIFGLNDPVEIHRMFTYLLNNGYLSNNKKFTFSDQNAHDIYNIQGANVINGEGVCRHIAPMLNDILQNKGIESKTLTVKAKPIDISIVPNFDQNISLEELYKETEKIISSKERLTLLNDLIKICEGKIKIMPNDKKEPLLRKLLINHMIVKTIYDEKIHFLDPTQNRIYKYSQKEKVLYDESGILTLKKKKGLDLESTTFNEDLEKIVKIEKLCNNNIDILDTFYNEHNEAYKEISNKMNKIKTRKIPFF